MEEMTSPWSCHENVDQLKELLVYTTIELESAREEMKRNEESTNQLVQILNQTRQERDEAKDQLQMLMNKSIPSSSTLTNFFPVLSCLQSESPPMINSKGNSSISDCDSLSETYNHHSYGSLPLNSFFDPVSLSELQNLNMGDSINGCISMGTDQDSMRMDNLVKGKVLPEKGKLLQSVMEAGPLLETILLAGPLPRWRNPPPLQPLQIPALSSINCSQPVKNSSQLNPIPMLNFSSDFGGLDKGFFNKSIPLVKRQRIH